MDVLLQTRGTKLMFNIELFLFAGTSRMSDIKAFSFNNNTD